MTCFLCDRETAITFGPYIDPNDICVCQKCLRKEAQVIEKELRRRARQERWSTLLFLLAVTTVGAAVWAAYEILVR